MIYCSLVYKDYLFHDIRQHTDNKDSRLLFSKLLVLNLTLRWSIFHVTKCIAFKESVCKCISSDCLNEASVKSVLWKAAEVKLPLFPFQHGYKARPFFVLMFLSGDDCCNIPYICWTIAWRRLFYIHTQFSTDHQTEITPRSLSKSAICFSANTNTVYGIWRTRGKNTEEKRGRSLFFKMWVLIFFKKSAFFCQSNLLGLGLIVKSS